MGPVTGAGLPHVALIAIEDVAPAPEIWRPHGDASNYRYASRAQLGKFASRLPVLGRPEATCAALIPIRKSPAWWAMAQDERLALFAGRAAGHGERGVGHNAIGPDALPGVARRLLHCRDLVAKDGSIAESRGEPFDFLTWFELAPAETPAFDSLLHRLRATAKWSFVEREVEIRLIRTPI